MKNKYSVFSLIKNALSQHENWQQAWGNPEPKKEYDAIIVGGGGPGLATAYYLAKKHNLKNIDFLITIESSIAQLAGTMGINTYLLLSYNPYWIWYSEQEKAKFYDTIKIYQQDKPGSWDNAINQLEKDLNKYY